MKLTLIDIRELKKYFTVKAGFLSGNQNITKAVDGVSLRIFKGETLGLVGESGCGKSTLGRLILRLEEPTEGQIFFEEENIFNFSGVHLKDYRKKVQIIFQDPYASLNPRRTAGNTIGEPLLVNKIKFDKKEREDEIARMMDIVGLTREQKDRYPHEFSGGQRQRIGIARALVLRPKLIVADEPVSALDVSIQAQILNLLKELQKEFSLTYLFISHDLSVVRHISDRIAVMHFGRIVELAKNRELYENPLHPYTMELLSAVPIPDPKRKKQRPMQNVEIAGTMDTTKGCPFHPRCPVKVEMCYEDEPELKDRGDDHFVACHMEGCKIRCTNFESDLSVQ
ncbi:MAG TPA: oligopeptide/dipeptide ABC transporter ATP-binding protein [Syntrophales bacterium]|nr:oligopeptide/dipeptide ABC transporter ATP-binding protein [Syntrophales bacterium]